MASDPLAAASQRAACAFRFYLPVERLGDLKGGLGSLAVAVAVRREKSLAPHVHWRPPPRELAPPPPRADSCRFLGLLARHGRWPVARRDACEPTPRRNRRPVP